jgi:thiol-disulfide isomerase/thioredoxin
MRRFMTIATAAAIACASTLVAQDTDKKPGTLKAGDKAPAIKVGTWVKGKPVTTFESGKVYVMEFWATWCGPCIRGIPHLTKLQKEYKDQGVTVVGTAIWQRAETQADRQAKVTSFVTTQGDKMNYTIAVDDDKWMANNWMRPAGRNGIPSAFIVGKTGKIEWIGHPISMDNALKGIVAGTFDRAAFAKKEAADRKWEKAKQRIFTAVGKAQRDDDGAKALSLLDDAVKEYPGVADLQQQRYRLMLQYANSSSAVTAYGKVIAKDNWDDSMFLNSICWWTVDDKDARHRNLDQALAWAERANELTKNEDPQVLDTLARCFWEKGNTRKAIAIQRRAVEFAPDNMKVQIEGTLNEYVRDAGAA